VLVNAYGLWLDHVGMADPFTLSEAELAAAKWADPARARTEPSIVVSDPAQPHQAGLDRARNLGTATKFMWPIADRGLRRRLGYIHAPTLVVHGAADGLIPAAYADEFGRLIPNARVLHLDGAGHLPMVEREHAFVSAVEGFLSE
jgi:pimeloyl-ACP methyl ester carboxylesterase